MGEDLAVPSLQLGHPKAQPGALPAVKMPDANIAVVVIHGSIVLAAKSLPVLKARVIYHKLTDGAMTISLKRVNLYLLGDKP